MEIFEYMESEGHEQLLVWSDPTVGLKAFVAIHDSTLGPACGGVRIWPHKSEHDAQLDVLRLSKAMTYKSAMAGLNLGGGKALIWADSRKDKTPSLLRSFGRFVDSIGGRYVTTEDVGMTPQDLEYVAEETEHVAGLPLSDGGSGDTSVMTGLGLYLGMKSCANEIWGNDDLSDRVIAIQGFGNVATNTAKHLLRDGARLVVTDIHDDVLVRAREIGAKIVKPDEIFDVECDIFSPCALGGVLNSETIPRLKCSIVAGGANNQLLHTDNAMELHDMGILYAPDFVVNAGGIINVACEVGTEYSESRAIELTERIYDTTSRVIKASRQEGTTTVESAIRLSEAIISKSSGCH